MATGIRESDLINMIHYHEYKGDEKDFTHLSVKVQFSPLDRTEHTINHHLQGADLSNLSKVEKMFLQNKIETITINDNVLDTSSQSTSDSIRISEVIQKDLSYIDESSLSIINAIQTQEQGIHTGQDEDTLALVNRLEKERELEQNNYKKERLTKLKKQLEKTEANFPKLDKAKSKETTQ